ncbi:MAG TPA: hypothetical protein VGE01_09685 [Fimbriimonas sp.]
MNPLPFPPNSRYFAADTRQTVVDGRTLTYLSRRFVPPPERFQTLGYHQVQAGDRPDLLAYRSLGDPEQFWKIADANAVLHPMELTEVVGRLVRMTLPEGTPGPQEDR